MDRWASACPSEDDETDRKAWRGVQQPPKTCLVLRLLIIGVVATKALVALDSREEREPRDEIANTDSDEGQSNSVGGKVPLLVYECV